MEKVLYLECNMGAAGDMLTAALYELLEEDTKKEFCRIMDREELGIRVVPEIVEKCGVQGTHMSVLVEGKEEMEQEHSQGGHSHVQDHQREHGHAQDHQREHGHAQDHQGGHDHVQDHQGEHSHVHKHGHHHASLSEVFAMIEAYPVSETVQNAAKAVYERIAAAESHAHGKPVSEIHFHEVGMKDAIADVVNVCWIIDQLAADQIIVSDINVGYGEVHCVHGILPVPAPATAFLLQGAPLYQGEIRGELCTPTGAALLQHIHTAYGRMPAMKIEKTGYGMGQKDFPQANCVRAFLGKGVSEASGQIVELSCNLDDMSGEEIAFACEILRNHGALDVYTESIGMKKSRPGVKLVCMCRKADMDILLQMLLQHTSTWGVRKAEYERYTLECTTEMVETEYGKVRMKTGKGYGITKCKPEYEDLAAIARQKGIALREIVRSLPKY